MTADVLVAALAIALSVALLGTLGLRDPKRLRNQARAGVSEPSPQLLSAAARRLLGWLSLAPGLVLLITGNWWALLVWLGAICTAGWVAAHVLAIRSPHDTARSCD